VFRDSAADDGGRAVASGASGFHDAVVEVAVGVAERRHRGAREALERVLASGKLAKEVVVGEPGEWAMRRPVRSDLDSGGVERMDLVRREERFSRGLRVPVVHARGGGGGWVPAGGGGASPGGPRSQVFPPPNLAPPDKEGGQEFAERSAG